MITDFGGLSKYLALSSICEVQRGEGADQVVGVRDEGEITRSQRYPCYADCRTRLIHFFSNLNHRRYAVNDETLYVAPSDKRTDYSQPPMSNFYYGVLNTGRRRYAHPALTGLLPQPWLPAKAKPRAFGDGPAERRGVVLSLRRKMSKRQQRSDSQDDSGEGGSDSLAIPDGWKTGENDAGGRSRSSTKSNGATSRVAGSANSTSSNPWGEPISRTSEPGILRKQNSPGRIGLSEEEDNVWGDTAEEEEDDDGEEQELEPVSGNFTFEWGNRIEL